MRYYDLIITPQGSTTPFRRWTSHPNGKFDSAAQTIEFDMPVAPYHTPSGGQTISIHGVPLQDITQAQQFTGMNLSLRGGMQRGLPLANPNQAGLLVVGQVFQSFGNWEGTEMTLDLVILPSTYTEDNPGNFLLNWSAGTKLSDALQQTFSVAYPGMPISMNIGSNLVNSHDHVHFCPTLEELAMHVADVTDTNFDSLVSIGIQNGKITVSDKTYAPQAVQINFTDMIGQPTWIDKNIMQVKTVMRADLQVNSIIAMPKGMQNLPGLVATQANAYPSSFKYQSAFQNNFTIKELRHIGNYRASDAAEWCTVFNCLGNG